MNNDPTLDLRTGDVTTLDGPAGVHPLSTAHLVMGVLFLALAGTWALAAGGVVSGDDLRWLLPMPFVLGGAIGLIALGLTARRRAPVRG